MRLQESVPKKIFLALKKKNQSIKVTNNEKVSSTLASRGSIIFLQISLPRLHQITSMG